MTEEQRCALGDVLGALQRGRISSAEAIERTLIALIADDSDPLDQLTIPTWRDFDAPKPPA